MKIVEEKKEIVNEQTDSLVDIKYRSDIICYNNTGKAILIVECKSSTIKLQSNVFDQVQNYNAVLNTNCMIITNGKKTICFDIKNNKIKLKKQIPNFSELKNNY